MMGIIVENGNHEEMETEPTAQSVPEDEEEKQLTTKEKMLLARKNLDERMKKM